MSSPEWHRIADMPVTEALSAEPSLYGTGRRVRVFQRLAHATFYAYAKETPVPTVADVMTRVPSLYVAEEMHRPTVGGDPSLHYALQDLGDDINMDEHDACEAAHAGLPFAGVDDGIEPVTDEHVRRVIPALQRELDRERRRGLPAVPLDAMPWPYQRALVERRRLRYQQFGITHEVWKRGTWSLWDVPCDDDYIPFRARYELAGKISPATEFTADWGDIGYYVV